MLSKLKVKDNKNLSFIIVPFCIFPLIFFGIAGVFNVSYLVSSIIMIFLFAIYMVFILKHIKSQEDVYAIIADETEITFIKKGTHKWAEIESVKAISIYSRYKPKLLLITLKNGNYFKINVTNFDYTNDDLEVICKNLGKLEN